VPLDQRSQGRILCRAGFETIDASGCVVSGAEDVTMRAVWITRPAGPRALEVRETADPEPGPGQVRIRVRAAGLNFAEVMAAQGLYPDAPKPPCVVGY